jgi:hypothetical protein
VALHEDETGVFRTLAQRINDDVAPPAGALGCSARLLEAIDKALQSSS